MAILTTHKLKKHYGAEPNIVRALDGIDLEIGAREFVAVVGQSGSGKNTLLLLPMLCRSACLCVSASWPRWRVSA